MLQNGLLNCVVALASGSTGRSIDVVGTQHVTALDVAMRAYGLRRIRAWTQRGLEFHPIGYLRLGRSDRDLQLFERSLGYQLEFGIDSARILDPAEIRALVPDMSTDGITGGLFGPDNGFLDPYQLSSLLAEMEREKGGTVRQRCRLFGANRRVAELFGQALPVVPERHEAVTIRLPEPLKYVMPMVMDLVYGGGGTGLNFRHDRPGQLVTEIHKSADTWVADPDDYNEQIEDTGKEYSAELLLERLPGLSGAGFGHGWAGLYPESIDRLPLVGPFDGEPHLIAAAGASGYGIQLSPIIGALAADWITEGAPITRPKRQHSDQTASGLAPPNKPEQTRRRYYSSACFELVVREQSITDRPRTGFALLGTNCYKYGSTRSSTPIMRWRGWHTRSTGSSSNSGLGDLHPPARPPAAAHRA